jgi:hypothetical protein
MGEGPYVPPAYLAERLTLPDPGFMLDWYLARHREVWDSWEQKDNPTWRASSLGNCLRAQTLQRRGVPSMRTFDEKTIRTFAWGDEVHKFVRKVFWRMGLVIAEEPLLEDPARDCVGHADLIWTPAGFTQADDDAKREGWSDDWNVFLDAIRNLWAEELYGLYEGRDYPNITLGMELKSAHSFAMKRMFSEGPYEHHKVQAGAYKLMAQTTPADANAQRWPGLVLADAVRWTLTYVGKDSVGVLSYEVEDEWVERAEKRLDDLNRFWKAHSLPPCTCVDWQVKYCDYAEGTTCCGRNLKGRVARAIRKVETDA